MTDTDTPETPPRVVALAREIDSGDLQYLPEGVRCVRVGTGYEAAAELLADPPAALVVELGALTARHLPLLEVARRVGVEVLGVGSLPAGRSTAELSGVRLIAPQSLAGALERLAGQAAPPRAAEPVHGEAAAPAARLTPAKAAQPPLAEPAEEGQWQGASHGEADDEALEEFLEPAPPEAQPPPRRDEAQKPLRELLTPEELSALLEDEP
jgi:hypothetical protein